MSPRLGWPTVVESVAAPIVQTAAVRMPAISNRRDQGRLDEAEFLPRRHALLPSRTAITAAGSIRQVTSGVTAHGHDGVAETPPRRGAPGRAGADGGHSHRGGLDDRRRDALHHVGQPSLGDMIFAGLQTQNWALVLAGCLAAALLALTVDALLGVIEHGIAARKRTRAFVAAGLLAIGVLAALAPLWPRGGQTVVVGAKGFSEQYILARVIGHRLEAAGYHVEYREGLGSVVAFAAAAGGDVDVYVDYSGTIWTNEMKRTDVPARPAIVQGVAAWAAREHGVGLAGTLGFENTYAFAMRGDDAARRHVTSIADLTAIAPQLRFATDIEFLERPEWAAVKRAYGSRIQIGTSYQPTSCSGR